MSYEKINYLRNSGGVFFCQDASAFIDSCRDDSGIIVFELISKDCLNENSFYKSISKLLSFPDYFGENPNALVDCMRDKFRSSGKSVVLYVRGASDFLSSSTAASLHSVLAGFVFSAQECRRIHSSSAEETAEFFLVVIDYADH